MLYSVTALVTNDHTNDLASGRAITITDVRLHCPWDAILTTVTMAGLDTRAVHRN